MSIKSKMTEKTLKNMEKTTGNKLTLGKLIWAIRKSDEVSQVDFAEKLKITKQHLCDIEHGRKSISPRLAYNYAKVLGYSREQFVRLALQELIDRDGLKMDVEIIQRGRRKHNDDSRIAA